MYTARTLATSLMRASRSFPVILVTGPRQVGKTTLLQQIGKDERTYVTLDDPLLRTLAKEDPALFLQRFPPPLLIDEIQYAPELFPFIKMEVDRQGNKGMYWLTGSQQFHLMQNISESLAGRVGILRLQGLSQTEKENDAETSPFIPTLEALKKRHHHPLNITQLYEYIWRGSFPALVLDKKIEHSLFYSSYVQTYLQRDIRDLARVGDEQAFLRFLRAIAARTGQLINYSNLARDVDISAPTAKSWLSIIEASGLIYILEPYHNNLSKRLIKSPKLYFLDTGLCCYLTGWTSPETLEVGAMSGAILETYIVSELLKSYWHCGQEAPFFFYRDKDFKECDLLIFLNGILYPLEFKKTANPKREVVNNFNVLRNLSTPIGHSGVICLLEKLIPLSINIEGIPIGYL